MKYKGKELYYTTKVSNYGRIFVYKGETLCTRNEENVIFDELNLELILNPGFGDNKLIEDDIVYAVGTHDLKSIHCDGPDIYDYESLLKVAANINLTSWANITIPTEKEEGNVKLKK